MSWHYLQEQEEVSSEDISWDGEQFVQSKSKTTLGEYCLPDNETESFQDSQYGMTLRRSTENPGEAELMWYQGDSPVRTYLPQEKEQEFVVSDLECGPRWPESLARYNPDSYSWRTAQCSLVEGLESFSEIFPNWGMMRDGECWEDDTPEPTVVERESGFWPAPTKSWGEGREGGSGARDNFTLRLGVSNKVLGLHMRKKLSPNFGEMLMGWTTGWTDLKPLAMDKFQQWQHLHGNY